MKVASLFPALLATSGIALAASSMPAQAFNLGVNQVTNNTNLNVASQFNIAVDQLSNGKVQFTFTNTGSIQSAITDIYFGKGTNFSNLLTYDSIINNSSVNFSPWANPSQPPAGEFGWTAAFSADSDTPIVAKGIGLGENLKILFNLTPGTTLSTIENGFLQNNLAIALHAQAIGPNSKSDWFQSKPNNTTSVPEPSAMLGLMAIGFGGFLKQKNSQNKKTEKVTA